MNDTTDAVKILHKRYIGDDPERQASLDAELRAAELEALDRLMAEKVMGLHWEKRDIYSSLGEELNVWGWLDKDDWPIGLWQPSLRIEQAMECYRKFRTKNLGLYLMLEDVGDYWIATMYEVKSHKFGSQQVASKSAKEPAEAICRALKEVMG